MEFLFEKTVTLPESPVDVGDMQPVSLARVRRPAPVVLSFDVEEHHRIEAAAGLTVDSRMQEEYRERMRRATEWILEQLAAWRISATFFIVGQIAETNAALVRSIHDAGHEVASHGWDHRRIHAMTPQAFREDVQRSKQALEQATGAGVVGYLRPPSAWSERPHGPSTYSRSWSFSTTRRSIPSVTIDTACQASSQPVPGPERRSRDPRDPSGHHPNRWRESARWRWWVLPASAPSAHEDGTLDVAA